jgi:predicted AAA+ superfamily ATPase
MLFYPLFYVVFFSKNPLFCDIFMLNRLIISDFHKWKTSANRKPLVLRGARQVGKTVAVRMFGNSYTHFSELNLEIAENASLFECGLNSTEILQSIKLRHRIPANTESWLLFLDEIQESPAAVKMLRHFYEEHPQVHVIAAGSLLEIALQREHISFPVGRVVFRYLHPMNFEEFLEATAGAEMVSAFHEVPSPSYAEADLFSHYHRYALVGGMPEAVARYAESRDIVEVNSVYESLFTAYMDDIPKYAKSAAGTHILRHCLRSAPFLAGKRIKFAGFGESNYGSREVGEALRTLEQVMLIAMLYPSTATVAPFIPNFRKSPRLQFIDTGLIHYLSGIQTELIGIDDLSSGFRGGLLEQLTGQELLALRRDARKIPLFWVRDKTQSQAEVDFLQPRGTRALPIEVKSGAAGKLRSLGCFMELAPATTVAVRLYRGPFLAQDAGKAKPFRLLNLPYYHASKIDRYLEL